MPFSRVLDDAVEGQRPILHQTLHCRTVRVVARAPAPSLAEDVLPQRQYNSFTSFPTTKAGARNADTGSVQIIESQEGEQRAVRVGDVRSESPREALMPFLIIGE